MIDTFRIFTQATVTGTSHGPVSVCNVSVLMKFIRHKGSASTKHIQNIQYIRVLNTHTHPFNGPFSGTTWVSQYQKGKTNLDFTEARDSEWQWHQLGHMQVGISLQTDNHASTPPLKFFTGRMPFLPPNQQRQSTEGNIRVLEHLKKISDPNFLTV